MRVLVAEDEPAVADNIKTWLERSGFRVELAHTGEEAWFLGDTEEFAAVVLDLGLPRMDGLTVLKRWRFDGKAMPVIILTARGSWMERVKKSTPAPTIIFPNLFRWRNWLRACMPCFADRLGKQ